LELEKKAKIYCLNKGENIMKKNNGISSIVLLIIAIIVLIAAGVFWMYSQGMFDKKEETKQTNKNLSQVSNNVKEDDDEDFDYDEDEDEYDFDFNVEEEYVSDEIMGHWFGKYTASNGNQVVIYRSSRSRINVDITAKNEDGFVSSYEVGGVEVDSAEKIKYEDSMFDEKTTLELELNGDNLLLKASSNEKESLLNNVDGTYKKEESQTKGWNGVYSNDKYEIILSENYDDQVIVMIDSFWERYSDEFDENKIEYEKDFFDDKEIFTIEKTDTGIKVVKSSSTDEESVLNEIEGLEFKKMN